MPFRQRTFRIVCHGGPTTSSTGSGSSHCSTSVQQRDTMRVHRLLGHPRRRSYEGEGKGYRVGEWRPCEGCSKAKAHRFAASRTTELRRVDDDLITTQGADLRKQQLRHGLRERRQQGEIHPVPAKEKRHSRRSQERHPRQCYSDRMEDRHYLLIGDESTRDIFKDCRPN